MRSFIGRHKRVLTITVAVVALFSVFVGMALADDLVRTDVGEREHHVGPGGNVAVAEVLVRVYASQFDADGDGDTTADSQRAVARAFKVRNILRVQINSVRLQRYTSTGWETLKSAGPVNSGTSSQAVAYTAPPTPFRCNGSTIYRVQVIGLGRVASSNSLFSFNKESDHWVMVPGGSGSCVPVYI